MQLLIQQVTLFAPKSEFHLQTKDVLIQDDSIQQIADSISVKAEQVIPASGYVLSLGWLDGLVSFGEPGYEERETIANGLQVAAKSGFTHVILQPNTLPVTDNEVQVSWLQQASQHTATKILVQGALTQKMEGNHMAEMYAMHQAGAVCFGDYGKSVDNSLLLKIALEYTKDFNGLVVAFSQDTHLALKGYVHEGEVSTALGMKGIPAMAEAVAIARNLAILEYTGGKLHLPLISTLASVKLIQVAKSKGLQVTCSVSVHHLCLTDENLASFDANYKVRPPLRDEATRQGLVQAVLDGVIDIIVTDHCPIDIEHKKLEFDLAKFGTIGLESAFGALCQVLPWEVVVEKLTSGYAVFGVEEPHIEVGQKANLTLFDPNKSWEFQEKDILSKSKNAAFLSKPMKGKAVAVMHQNKVVYGN
jgi:dihydroorotase